MKFIRATIQCVTEESVSSLRENLGDLGFDVVLLEETNLESLERIRVRAKKREANPPFVQGDFLDSCLDS